MVILGVDPGTRVTGFGFIEADGDRLIHIRHGVIALREKDSLAVRLGELSENLRALMEQHRPRAVAIEQIFLGKNVDSAFKLGHARGVLMSEASKGGAEVFEYATRSMKKGVTGNGGASKEETQMVVQNLLGIHGIAKLDASDALALACHHAFESRKAAVLRRGMEFR